MSFQMFFGLVGCGYMFYSQVIEDPHVLILSFLLFVASFMIPRD